MEIWKPVVGYEKYYKVSNLGNIYSNFYNRLLIPNLNKRNGYLYVFLCKAPNDHKYCSVHRIVGMAFVDGYEQGLCINHKNEIKTDNRAENLEWCTKAYNNTYNDKNAKCYKSVNQYDMNGQFIKCWECAKQAFRVLGIHYKNISAVCRGKRKSAGGYIWKFKECE